MNTKEKFFSKINDLNLEEEYAIETLEEIFINLALPMSFEFFEKFKNFMSHYLPENEMAKLSQIYFLVYHIRHNNVNEISTLKDQLRILDGKIKQMIFIEAMGEDFINSKTELEREEQESRYKIFWNSPDHCR